MTENVPRDFYVTCATVIPVLFLAAAVQGPAYGWLLRTTERADRYSRQSFRRILETVLSGQPAPQPQPRWQGTRETLAEITSSIVAVLALVIVVAGGFGEGLAIYVLYRGSEPTGARSLVFAATLVLVGAVVVGPLLAGLRAILPRDKDIDDLMARVKQAASDLAQAAEAQRSEPPKVAEGPAPGRTTTDREP